MVQPLRRRLGVSLVIILSALSSLAADRPTPQSVRNLLATKGGPQTVQLLFEDDATWDLVLKGVSSGRADWLRVAKELRPFTDAHSSETLEMAIEDALLPAPKLALELFGVEACGDSSLAMEEPSSLAHVLREVAKRKKAVATVQSQSLASTKKECLRLLDETAKSAPSWNYGPRE